MREIKFRQRNKNNGQWFYWGFINGNWVNPKQQDNYSNPEESDRYTGLPDKNGKEIYEGDIVKTPYNDVYDFAYYGVIWYRERAAWYTDCLALHHKTKGFEDISKGGYCVGFLGNEQEMELIGNIYENPELLKEK